MKPFDRDLLVLIKTDLMTEQAIEREVEKLHYIFLDLESADCFAVCHELVNRNYITDKLSRLRNVFYENELKPFCFLICKN